MVNGINAVKQAKLKIPAWNNYIEVVLILDKSASMYGTQENIINAFNGFLFSLHSNKKIYLRTILFDENSESIYHGKLYKSEPFTYILGGATALFDAIIFAIKEVNREKVSSSDKHYVGADVLYIIISDGYDNSSSTTSCDNILNEVINEKEKEEKGRRFFMYLGEFGLNIDEIVEIIGIRKEHGQFFFRDKSGIELLYNMIIENVKEFYYRRTINLERDDFTYNSLSINEIKIRSEKVKIILDENELNIKDLEIYASLRIANLNEVEDKKIVNFIEKYKICLKCIENLKSCKNTGLNLELNICKYENEINRILSLAINNYIKRIEYELISKSKYFLNKDVSDETIKNMHKEVERVDSKISIDRRENYRKTIPRIIILDKNLYEFKNFYLNLNSNSINQYDLNNFIQSYSQFKDWLFVIRTRWGK